MNCGWPVAPPRPDRRRSPVLWIAIVFAALCVGGAWGFLRMRSIADAPVAMEHIHGWGRLMHNGLLICEECGVSKTICPPPVGARTP